MRTKKDNFPPNSKRHGELGRSKGSPRLAEQQSGKFLRKIWKMDDRSWRKFDETRIIESYLQEK